MISLTGTIIYTYRKNTRRNDGRDQKFINIDRT